ncbi:hypothetical protein EXIGLDRAFT_58501 [Exidia glandulosa HHB12029]|uniref:Uncharacterized protein n=1 Tax=Exidia glandulosa HHB12029 TaxID=1314781 RepID=A0A165I6Y3_EXIGL|nr:hypothetical protein EXIGLDRAFT_58501 [Exidia glandulosa HHB12029]
MFAAPRKRRLRRPHRPRLPPPNDDLAAADTVIKEILLNANGKTGCFEILGDSQHDSCSPPCVRLATTSPSEDTCVLFTIRPTISQLRRLPRSRRLLLLRRTSSLLRPARVRPTSLFPGVVGALFPSPSLSFARPRRMSLCPRHSRRFLPPSPPSSVHPLLPRCSRPPRV